MRRPAIFVIFLVLLTVAAVAAAQVVIGPVQILPRPLQPTIDPIIDLRVSDPAQGGAWFQLPIGPFPADDTIGQGVGSVDVDTATAKPELLVFRDKRIDCYDAGGNPTCSFSPQPTVVIDALVGIEIAGSTSARDELILAGGGSLRVLDLDAGNPTWNIFSPAPPLVPTALAAVDVSGGAELELIASDGNTIWALDTHAGGPAWTQLPAPPGAPDGMAGQDVAFGDPADVPNLQAARVLVVSVGDTWYHYDRLTALWGLPYQRRFGIKSSAPTRPIQLASGPLGDIVVPRPLKTSGITFEQDAGGAGLAVFDPAGDVHCPGAVFTDLDGDDDPDIYLVRTTASSQGGGSSLYRNDGAGPGGQVTFTAIANAGGASAAIGDSAGALAGDFTGDGIRDLYIANFTGPNILYRGDGAGGYSDVTALTDPTPDGAGDLQDGLALGCDPNLGDDTLVGCNLDLTLAAAAGDFNRDGWLDLYVGNQECCNLGDNGERDVLYLSDGPHAGQTPTFTDITIAAGIEVPNPLYDTSTMAVLVADFDNDLWPDIYVANKSFGPPRDRLYMNDGDQDGTPGWDGTFTEWFTFQDTLPTGDPRLGDVTCEAMGIDAADHDLDGDLDIFISDLSKDCLGTGFTDMELYRNRLVEDGTFALELVEPNPVAAPGWGWGTSWSDFDNDGDHDLHMATNSGYIDWLYRNKAAQGSPDAFVDVTVDSQVLQALDSRASIPADYDADGRMDLLVINRDGDKRPALFHNITKKNANRHWVAVKLVGDPALPANPFHSTFDAVGARIEVTASGTKLRRDIYAGGHICASTREYIAHFGTGSATTVDIEVFWPSGRTTQRLAEPVDRLVVITEQ